MKFNHDMLDVMRKATNLLQSGKKGEATNAIQRLLQRVLPGSESTGAPVLNPIMKDINPPPSRDQQVEPQAAGNNVPHSPVPDFVADLMNRFGMPAPESSRTLMPDHADSVATPGKFLSGSFSNNAGMRKYKLYVPAAYTGKAVPLVVMLHGCTQNPDDFAAGTEMNAQAELTPCLVLYPAQSETANSSKCWNWFNAIDQQREQGEPSIIADMTREIIDTYAIERKQVYIAGLSAGGAMAAIMGNTYPELYAAVGIHSGLPYAAANDLPSAMQAMRAGISAARLAKTSSPKSQPIIVFHGDRDHTVHPKNGEQWIEQHVGPRAQSSVESGSVPGGHQYTRTMHRNADGAQVAEQWLIHGAGHAWSGGSSKGSYTDRRGPQATREMMRFFSTQRN